MRITAGTYCLVTLKQENRPFATKTQSRFSYALLSDSVGRGAFGTILNTIAYNFGSARTHAHARTHKQTNKQSFEFGCFHPVVCIYNLLECAVYTQQAVISCSLFQVVN